MWPKFGLDSLKWRQYAARSKIPLKWIYSIEGSRLLAYERRIAHGFSQAVVHIEIEKRDFERLIPGVAVGLVGNGVDLDYFRPKSEAKQRASIVFSGVMDYRPNVDAAEWFCNEILPIVRREIPAANFTICGNRPTTAVRRLARQQGVVVTGWVPDTRPYLASAEIFVAPLRMARGVQNKVLEVLAMGLPCVASMPAWSGTVIPAGEGILATDNPQQFAKYVICLLQDDAWRTEMATRARAAAEAYYRWQSQMGCFDDIIAAISGPPPDSA